MTKYILANDPLNLGRASHVDRNSTQTPGQWLAQHNTAGLTLIAAHIPADRAYEPDNCYVLRKDWHKPHSGVVIFIALPQGGGGDDDGGSNPLQIVASLAIAVFAPWAAGALLGTTSGLAFAATTALIGLGASALVSKAFAPQAKPAAQALPAPDPTYSNNITGNTLRLGEPIPEQFGTLCFAPDWTQAPYVVFQNDDEYLCAVYCLGAGRYFIQDQGFGAGINVHLHELGDYQLQTDATARISMLPNASWQASDLSNMELKDDSWTRWVYVTPPFAESDEVQFNIALSGLFNVNEETGDTTNRSVSFQFQWQQVNNSGDAIGTQYGATESITAATVNSIRRTYRYSTGSPGRYIVRMRRTNNPTNSSKARDAVYWHSAVAHNNSYTLPAENYHVALKIKATGKLDSNMQNQFFVRAKRLLEPLDGNFTDTTHHPYADSASPYAAAAELVRSASGLNADNYWDYLPPAQELQQLNLHSRGDGVVTTQDINYRFSSEMGIMDAMALVLTPVFAKPYSMGGAFYFAHQSADDPITQVFAEDISGYSHNRDLTEHLSADAVEVRFFDTRFTRWNTVMCRSSDAEPSNPQEITLNGVTDINDAYHQGMVQYCAGIVQNLTIPFKTNIRGRVPSPNDRVLLGFIDPLQARTSHVTAVTHDDTHVIIDLLDDPSIDYSVYGNTANVSFKWRDNQWSGFVVAGSDNPNQLSRIKIHKGTNGGWANLIDMQQHCFGSSEHPAEAIITDAKSNADIGADENPGTVGRVINVSSNDGHNVNVTCVRDEPILYQNFGHGAEANPRIADYAGTANFEIYPRATLMPIPYPSLSGAVIRLSWRHPNGAWEYLIYRGGVHIATVTDWNEYFYTTTASDNMTSALDFQIAARQRSGDVINISDGTFSVTPTRLMEGVGVNVESWDAGIQYSVTGDVLTVSWTAQADATDYAVTMTGAPFGHSGAASWHDLLDTTTANNSASVTLTTGYEFVNISITANTPAGNVTQFTATDAIAFDNTLRWDLPDGVPTRLTDTRIDANTVQIDWLPATNVTSYDVYIQVYETVGDLNGVPELGVVQRIAQNYPVTTNSVQFDFADGGNPLWATIRVHANGEDNQRITEEWLETPWQHLSQ